MASHIINDKQRFLATHLHNFYNFDSASDTVDLEKIIQRDLENALTADSQALVGCVRAWATDLTKDMQNIQVPTLGIVS